MTREQNYANHTHQPIPTYIVGLFWLLAVVGFGLRWFYIGGRYSMALGIAGILGAIFTLGSMSRTYTVTLQDRIIRLEERLRAAALLTPAQQQAYAGLSKRQIVALRFASDAELPALVERAAREHLTSDQIKREIKTWVPDWSRT